MDDICCADRVAWQAALTSPAMQAAWATDRRVEAAALRRRWRRLTWPGFCAVCRRPTRFRLRGRRAGPDRIDFRNDQYCGRCRLFARQRKVLAVLRDQLGDGPGRVYLTEQRSRLFARARRVLSACTVTGSEYLGPDVAGGAVRRGLRHEDVMALSFADAGLDAVLSCDVLEHVPDPDRALAEFARVLRPGGLLLLTVPFFSDRDASLRRAELRDGAVRHLLPPEHHTDPLTGRGALVFSEFGWDLLPRIAAAGFADVAVVLYWDQQQGQLGVPGEYLRARRR